MSNFSDYFEYRDGRLFWKVKTSNRVYVGKESGCFTKPGGHLSTRVDGKLYLTHRVIWEMHNGPIKEGMTVDHINGIPYDNRIENLRLATNAENNRNKLKHRDNRSGVLGVYWHSQISKWCARIMTDGKTVNLGCFETIAEAAKARNDAEIKYHGKFCARLSRQGCANDLDR